MCAACADGDGGAGAVMELKGASLRRHRVDHGMCPKCGKEAAPYYLCWDCRILGALARFLDRMSKEDILKREKVNGRVCFSVMPDYKLLLDQKTFATYLWDMDPDDKRLRPRLGRRPVDLDETLVSIFMAAGKPLTIEEIQSAWGKLRAKRKTESLAGDLSAIIRAQRRREDRNARRAATIQRSAP